jgi:hypothetical protein
MATFGLIDYDAASPEVRAIYDDIMATRATRTGSTTSGRRSRMTRHTSSGPGTASTRSWRPAPSIP